LAAGTGNGNVVLFPPEYWAASPVLTAIEALCPEVGTNLTSAQWRQYVTGQPYQTICPGYPGGPKQKGTRR
jgi:hypothetical protein